MLYRNYRFSFCFFLDLCNKTRLLSISVAIGLRQIHQLFVTQDKIEEAFELKMKMTELRRERRASCSLQKYKFLFKVSKNKNNSFSNVSRIIRSITRTYIDIVCLGERNDYEDEERKETSDLCSPNLRVVFQSLFPIRGVINILMRLPFGRVAGKRTEISSAKSRSQ